MSAIHLHSCVVMEGLTAACLESDQSEYPRANIAEYVEKEQKIAEFVFSAEGFWLCRSSRKIVVAPFELSLLVSVEAAEVASQVLDGMVGSWTRTNSRRRGDTMRRVDVACEKMPCRYAVC